MGLQYTAHLHCPSQMKSAKVSRVMHLIHTVHITLYIWKLMWFSWMYIYEVLPFSYLKGMCIRIYEWTYMNHVSRSNEYTGKNQEIYFSIFQKWFFYQKQDTVFFTIKRVFGQNFIYWEILWEIFLQKYSTLPPPSPPTINVDSDICIFIRWIMLHAAKNRISVLNFNLWQHQENWDFHKHSVIRNLCDQFSDFVTFSWLIYIWSSTEDADFQLKKYSWIAYSFTCIC